MAFKLEKGESSPTDTEAYLWNLSLHGTWRIFSWSGKQGSLESPRSVRLGKSVVSFPGLQLNSFPDLSTIIAQTKNKFAILETLEPEGETFKAQTSHSPSITPKTQHTITLTKTYFKLIQVTHHLQIISSALSTQSYPKGMMKQTSKLSQFIKPACPNKHPPKTFTKH